MAQRGKESKAQGIVGHAETRMFLRNDAERDVLFCGWGAVGQLFALVVKSAGFLYRLHRLTRVVQGGHFVNRTILRRAVR